MARPKVDSRLQNIENDISEIKEMMKNGNNQNIESENPDDSNVKKLDCLCPESKEVLEQNG